MEEHNEMNDIYDYEVDYFTHVRYHDGSNTISTGYLIRYWEKGDLETVWTILDFETEAEAHAWWNKSTADQLA